MKTPSEIKIKVPTHSPFRKKKEFKYTDINAPSEITLKDPLPPPHISQSLNRGGGGADIKWNGPLNTSSTEQFLTSKVSNVIEFGNLAKSNFKKKFEIERNRPFY